MFIKIHKPVTNTLRFKKSIFLIKFKNFFKFFKNSCKNNAGRNNSGVLTLFSKCAKRKKNISITCFMYLSKSLSRLVSVFRNKKKIFSMCRHTTGSLSIMPHIIGVVINQKIFSSVLPKKYWINGLPGNFALLANLNRYDIFSNVYILGFRKIATSAGTFCQVIDFFLDFNLIRVSLPSKKCMFLLGFNFVILGRNSQQQKKFCVVGKAGYNIIDGKKPKVRGVARNPVDHPHGGRTKTNKPEVSIWGWIAKKNK